MRTKPILFKTEMVKAILEGTKTQTRRIMKVQPVKMNNIRSSKVQEVIWFNYSLDETRSGQSNLFNNQMQL